MVGSVKEINKGILWRVSRGSGVLGKRVEEDPSEEEIFWLTHEGQEGIHHIRLWEKETLKLERVPWVLETDRGGQGQTLQPS